MPAEEKTLVTVPGAPRPNFDAYSLVVRASGDTIHIAGFMGDDPETGKIVGGGVGAQAVSTPGTTASSWLTNPGSSHEEHQDLSRSSGVQYRKDRSTKDVLHGYKARS